MIRIHDYTFLFVTFMRIHLQWKIISCQLSVSFYDLDAIFVEL